MAEPMTIDDFAGPAQAHTTAPPTQEPSNHAPQLDSGESVLSDAPATESEPKKSDFAQTGTSTGATATANPTTSSGWQAPAHSMQTEDLLKRINADAEAARASGTPPWDAAREQVMSSMSTSQQFATATPVRGRGRGAPRGRPRGSGRGAKRASLISNGEVEEGADSSTVKIEDENATPGSAGRGRGRGRGRGGGRPRGRGRGGGRGGKRKRDDDDEGGDSDSSDEVTLIATMTKSGRSIQKPTSFVPPPPSPTTNKRKRPYNRRNPESAVCKVCLRGVSPASNMIVFCDGCNTPYHRWCHKPPIDQAVIDESDKEWYCMNCEEDRAVPVPAADFTSLVSAGDTNEEQRRRYFSSLPQGLLVTLLVKATTLKPDLPLFDPQFKAPLANGDGTAAQPATNGAPEPSASATTQQPPRNGTAPPTKAFAPPSHPATNPYTAVGASAMHNHGSAFVYNQPAPDDAAYTDDVHPSNYPRPGQGLMKTLPPETEDLQWLVDDDDNSGVFTHLYQDPPGVVSAAAGGNAQANGMQ